MTEILCEYKNGRLNAISMSGHTEYGVCGSDIVCAGISTLIQALSIGLEEVLGLDNVETVFKNSGDEPFIRLSFPVNDDRVEILTKTIVLSIKEIHKAYPENVKFTEVHK